MLSTVPVMFNYWAKGQDCLQVSHYLNDDIAKTVQQYPDRFLGLGTLPMQDPKLRLVTSGAGRNAETASITSGA